MEGGEYVVVDVVSDALLGWLTGFLGALPFVHTNLLLELLKATPAFAVALAFSHLAFELLPMTLFGVPGLDQTITFLPAQDIVRKKNGVQSAFYLAFAGLVSGALFALVLCPVFFALWPVLYTLIQPRVGFVLSALVLSAWFSDGRPAGAALVFLGSGILGSAVFSLPVSEPLFPLLSGLFGVPAVLFAADWLSDSDSSAASWHLRHALFGAILGGMSVLLPALSPSFLASFAFFFFARSPSILLVLSTAVASSKMVFDFLASAVLHKARSGAAAVFLSHAVSLNDAVVLVLIGLICFTASLCVVWMAKNALVRLLKNLFSPTVFLVLVALGVYLVSGPLGLFVLAWSALFSTACLHAGGPRKYLLGALMLPAILYSFGLHL